MAAPRFGPSPAVTGRYSFPGGNAKLDLMNRIMANMSLTSEAITSFARGYDSQKPDGSWMATPESRAAEASARQTADSIRQQLSKISTIQLRSVWRETQFNKNSPMRNYLDSSALDRGQIEKRLGNLGINNYNEVEKNFLQPQSRAHDLDNLLGQSAETLITSKVQPKDIMRSLNYIKSQKDTGTGAGILQQLTSLSGQKAANYFSQDMNIKQLQSTYANQVQGIDINQLQLSGAAGMPQRRKKFMSDLVSSGAAPEDIAMAATILPTIRTNDAMSQIQQAFDTGGMPQVNASIQAIQNSARASKTKQLNLMQSINKFSFMKTTRGQVHAEVGMMTDLAEGVISPEVFLAQHAIQGVMLGAKVGANVLTASGGQWGGGFGNALLAGLSPEQFAAYRGLASVGQAGNLINTNINAAQSGRSVQQVAQSRMQMSSMGIPTANQNILQNMISGGVNGVGGPAVEQLMRGFTANASTTQFANLAGMANPATKPATFALAQNAPSNQSMSSVWPLVMMSGMAPNEALALAKTGETGMNKLIMATMKNYGMGAPSNDPYTEMIQDTMYQGLGGTNPLGYGAAVGDYNKEQSSPLNTLSAAQVALNDVHTQHGISRNPLSIVQGFQNGGFTGLFSAIGNMNDYGDVDAMDYKYGGGSEKYAQALTRHMISINPDLKNHPDEIVSALQHEKNLSNISTATLQTAVNKGLGNGTPGSSPGNPIYTIDVSRTNANTASTSASAATAGNGGNNTYSRN